MTGPGESLSEKSSFERGTHSNQFSILFSQMDLHFHKIEPFKHVVLAHSTFPAVSTEQQDSLIGTELSAATADSILV